MWALRLLRAALRALAAVMVIAGSIPLAFMAYPAYRRAMDDPGYAARYFDELVPYDQVLASRQWHPFDAEGWDCTFAIVDLADHAPERPGVRDRGSARWFMIWGGEWSPTPANPPGENERATLDICADDFSDDLNQRIERAMSEVGSYYLRTGVNETVFIYSLPQRIAARVRYGD